MHGVRCRLYAIGPHFLIESPVAGEDPAQALAWSGQQVLRKCGLVPGTHLTQGTLGARRRENRDRSDGTSAATPVHARGGQIYHGALRSAANVMKTIVF